MASNVSASPGRGQRSGVAFRADRDLIGPEPVAGAGLHVGGEGGRARGRIGRIATPRCGLSAPSAILPVPLVWTLYG